jgi:O-succinylbenzoate synthase
MSIESLWLGRYALDLTRPLILKGNTLHKREGLLLALTDDKGRVSWGEIAPLPGFSVETLDEVQAQAIAFFSSLNNLSVLESFIDSPGLPLGAFKDTPSDLNSYPRLDWYALAPSLRCGLSMALERSRMDVSALSTPGHVWLNGLMTGHEDVLESARDFRARGYRSVKLKVGPGDMEEHIERVYQVREVLGDTIQLRLDANQAWDFDAAVAFAKKVLPCSIEYIEEPLACPERLPEFSMASAMPYAVDESVAPLLGPFYCGLRDHMSAISPAQANCRILLDYRTMKSVLFAAQAVILKPTLVGEFANLFYMAVALGRSNTHCVMSSAFESGVALTAYAQLGLKMNENDDVPMGLDTLGWLTEDVIRPKMIPKRGAWVLAGMDEALRNIDQSKLTEVYSV